MLYEYYKINKNYINIYIPIIIFALFITILGVSFLVFILKTAIYLLLPIFIKLNEILIISFKLK
jgi:hypothetical protein